MRIETATLKLGHFPNNTNFTNYHSHCLWSNKSFNTNYHYDMLQLQNRFEKFMFPRNYFCHKPMSYICGKCHQRSETILSENSHFPNSSMSSSSYSLRGYCGVHDNLQHLSMNDFPIVRQDSHRNILPVNSENLHHHYKSKVPFSMCSCQMQKKLHNSKNSREETKNVKKYWKHKKRECNRRKRHRYIPKKSSSSVTLKSSHNQVGENKSVETIRKINKNMKEIVSIKESMNYKQEVESGNSSSENTIKSEMMFSLKNFVKKEEMEFQVSSANVLETQESSSCREKIPSYFIEKDSSPSNDDRKSIYTEYKESIQVTEQNVKCDKACNTESIDVTSYQWKNQLLSKKDTLNTTEIRKKKENSNFCLPTSMEKISHDSMNNTTQKSISCQHSNLSKTHERITIVPIIFPTGNWNEKFPGKNSVENNRRGEKQILESQGKLLSSASDFSLSESFATEITQLAKKCAFIVDTKESEILTNDISSSSSYSFSNSSTQIRQEEKQRVKKVSSGNNETFENIAKNSVTVRRILGIITSPEDFMYE